MHKAWFLISLLVIIVSSSAMAAGCDDVELRKKMIEGINGIEGLKHEGVEILDLKNGRNPIKKGDGFSCDYDAIDSEQTDLKLRVTISKNSLDQPMIEIQVIE